MSCPGKIYYSSCFVSHNSERFLKRIDVHHRKHPHALNGTSEFGKFLHTCCMVGTDIGNKPGFHLGKIVTNDLVLFVPGIADCIVEGGQKGLRGKLPVDEFLKLFKGGVQGEDLSTGRIGLEATPEIADIPIRYKGLQADKFTCVESPTPAIRVNAIRSGPFIDNLLHHGIPICGGTSIYKLADQGL